MKFLYQFSGNTNFPENITVTYEMQSSAWKCGQSTTVENKQTSGHVGKSQHDRENFPTKIFDSRSPPVTSFEALIRGAQSAKKNFRPPSTDWDRERDTHFILVVYCPSHMLVNLTNGVSLVVAEDSLFSAEGRSWPFQHQMPFRSI